MRSTEHGARPSSTKRAKQDQDVRHRPPPRRAPSPRRALQAQGAAQAVANHPIVFHQQQPHPKRITAARSHPPGRLRGIVMPVSCPVRDSPIFAPHHTARPSRPVLAPATCWPPSPCSGSAPRWCSPWPTGCWIPRRLTTSCWPPAPTRRLRRVRHALRALAGQGRRARRLAASQGATRICGCCAMPAPACSSHSCKADRTTDRCRRTPTTATWSRWASLFYEPLWLFYREDAAQRLHPGKRAGRVDGFHRLAAERRCPGQRRVPADGHTAGGQSSGQPRGREPARAIGPGGGRVARRATGRARAEFGTPSPRSCSGLLGSPGIALLDFGQADAYVRRFAFLTTSTLPRGVIDLARNLPARELHLIAPTANLWPSRHPPGADSIVRAGRPAGARAARAGSSDGASFRIRHGGAALAKEPALVCERHAPPPAATLPAVLAGQSDRRMWPGPGDGGRVLIPLSRLLPPLVDFPHPARGSSAGYGQLRRHRRRDGRARSRAVRAELDATRHA